MSFSHCRFYLDSSDGVSCHIMFVPCGLPTLQRKGDEFHISEAGAVDVRTVVLLYVNRAAGVKLALLFVYFFTVTIDE